MSRLAQMQNQMRGMCPTYRIAKRTTTIQALSKMLMSTTIRAGHVLAMIDDEYEHGEYQDHDE